MQNLSVLSQLVNDLEVSLDKFLGGRIELLQPKKGFRSGTDTVMMASAIPALEGDNVLEFGVGSGVALCCLGARVGRIDVYGVEIQAEIADLARRNLERCDMVGEIHCADIFDLPKELRMKQFDHVMINPPFFDAVAHTAPQIATKAKSHIAHTNVSDWVKIAGKRLKPKGSLTIIHRTESLMDILEGLGEFGDIRILPIASNLHLEAKTIIVQARKQSAGKLKLLPPFITHDLQKTETIRLKDITRGGSSLRELL